MEAREEAAIAAAPEAHSEEDNKKRIYLSLAMKIDMCIESELQLAMAEKPSLKEYCRKKSDKLGIDIQPSQIRRWKKKLDNMKRTVDSTRKKKSKVACTTGRRSRLHKWRDDLLPWVESLQAEGKQVLIRSCANRAKRLDRGLHRMKRYTVFAIVRQFLKSNGVVLIEKTHQSQEDPREKRNTASAFLEMTILLLQQPNRHKAFIINMDQTPYNVKEFGGKTLAKKGAKTVNVKEVKTLLGRITACLTVCADGTKLPPMFIFKGKPGGSIERKFGSFQKDAVYAVQENAWTNKQCMMLWVDQVLRPYVATAPPGIVPYLLLDKYRCHYQGSVARQIEELGVEWDILPGGCTGLIQPIDAGISKPWKCRLRYKLEEWLIASTNWERIAASVMRKLAAEWGVAAWNKTKEDVVYNAWRHEPFSYFPGEETRDMTYESDYDYSSSEDKGEEDTGDDVIESI